MTKQIKLSDKQKEVVRLMREGWELFVSTYEVTGSRGQLIYRSMKYSIDKNELSKKLHHSTFLSLRNADIVSAKPYRLTDLGKQLNIE